MSRAMTVRDLLKSLGVSAQEIERIRLDVGRDRFLDSIIVIPQETLSGGMGASPCISVVAVDVGFDWDDGRVFMRPLSPVQMAGDEFEIERKRAREASEIVGWADYVLRGPMTSEQKIAEVKRLITSRGKDTG